jgi:hypothetical protein
VARIAPQLSLRVASHQRQIPPGWASTMGTNHTTTATAPAAKATTVWRTRRTEPATATRANRAKLRTTDCRNPAAKPRAARAAAPCHDPGRARQARMISNGAMARSNEYVEMIDPLNQANGDVATTMPAASPTQRPPRSRPATTMSPAARAEANAATSTSESTGLSPVPPTRRPAST